MIMNIVRQPKLSIRKVRSGTAIAVPRDEAQLKMPVARPRSRGWNQSRTTRAQVGNCGASPTPNSKSGGEELAKALHESAEELGE